MRGLALYYILLSGIVRFSHVNQTLWDAEAPKKKKSFAFRYHNQGRNQYFCIFLIINSKSFFGTIFPEN